MSPLTSITQENIFKEIYNCIEQTRYWFGDLFSYLLPKPFDTRL